MSPSRLTLAVLTILVAALSASAALAGTEKVLHSFNVALTGGNPQSSLIADARGNLYGTASTGGAVGAGLVFKLTPTASGNWTETVLHNFTGGADGYYPLSGLVFDKAGNLYGTTSSSASVCTPCQGPGTVFELSPNANGTWTEKVIHTFQPQHDGWLPMGSLIFDSAGNLYGTTVYGGSHPCSCGIVFELLPAQQGEWKESILYSFNGRNGDQGPLGGVIFDSAGNLYGTTNGNSGGVGACGPCGTAFELSPSSTGQWTETILYQFTGYGDGGAPTGGLVFDSAGNLYGNAQTAVNGDPNNSVVFELSPSSGGGWTEKVLSLNVYTPVGSLVLDSVGNLYGVSNGWPGTIGGIFELSPTAGGGWATKPLYNFAENTLDGSAPLGGLVMDAAGNLYGPTLTGGGVNCYTGFFNYPGCGSVFKMSRSSNGNWKETQIYNFPGSDGQYPTGLTSDGLGNFYGSTGGGGIYGQGEILKFSRSGSSWTTTSLYSFTGLSDGGYPNPVVLGPDGNLYGTTLFGGELIYNCGGVAFKLSPNSDGSWTEATIHLFLGTRKRDGCSPSFNSLIFDQAGNLYGTTQNGGSVCPTNFTNGCGTVFELSPAADGKWSETILHKFYAAADGLGAGSLIFDSSGNLFGLSGGGTNCINYGGCGGLLFEMSPAQHGQWSYNVLYDFPITQGSDTSPASIVFDSNGNLIGESAGGQYNCGAIFELAPLAGTWNLSNLYSFTGNGDGCVPEYGLTLDTNGNLYGTTYFTSTQYGGAGTVFELSPAGTGWNFNSLYTFTGLKDGGNPATNLVLDSSGTVYGMTNYGGSGTGGVIFEVQP